MWHIILLWFMVWLSIIISFEVGQCWNIKVMKCLWFELSENSNNK
jgi:hypothetical protein